MKVRICAVVVTYNRLGSLKKCVSALLSQTRVIDEIIIVNNDSKDGTKEWLDNQSNLTKLHQENLGGAGGFFNGINLAYKKDFDWIWLMDDDCLPEKNALQRLLDTKYTSNVVLNSVVLSETNGNELNFGLEDNTTRKLFRTYEEIKNTKYIFGANFFNGTLVHSSIIKNIGLPNPLFFIYGDEYEYYLRIKSNHFPIVTVVSSIVKHPQRKHCYFGRGKLYFRYNYLNGLRTKYFPRNLMAIYYLYDEINFKRVIKTYILDIYGIFVIQKKPIYFFSYLASIVNGLFFTFKLKKND